MVGGEGSYLSVGVSITGCRMLTCRCIGGWKGIAVFVDLCWSET